MPTCAGGRIKRSTRCEHTGGLKRTMELIVFTHCNAPAFFPTLLGSSVAGEIGDFFYVAGIIAKTASTGHKNIP